jgi:hypothetical protein
MITGSFNGTDQVAADTIRARGDRFIPALVRKVNSLALRLQQKIIVKLSGQVLNIRSGKGAGSVRVTLATPGDTVTADVQAGGGPAWYLKLHEFGTDAPYTILPINKQALAFMLGGKMVIVRKVIHPPIKERSFMRTSIAEMAGQIQTEIAEVMSNG